MFCEEKKKRIQRHWDRDSDREKKNTVNAKYSSETKKRHNAPMELKLRIKTRNERKKSEEPEQILAIWMLLEMFSASDEWRIKSI